MTYDYPSIVRIYDSPVNPEQTMAMLFLVLTLSLTIYVELQGSSYEEKNSGMLKGKSVSKSPLSSKISKSRIGELVTEVGAETISVISDSEVCMFWHNSPVLSKWYADKQKGFDSEVAGDKNTGEKLSMKWFSNIVSGNMLSSFSDPIDGEGKENHGKISSLVSNSSVLTLSSVSKVKITSGVCCCIFSRSG